MSAIFEQASSGAIGAFYGSSWFCKIYPRPSIGQMLFSFAEINKKGEGFDVYMDIAQFAVWMKHIDNYNLFRVVDKEKVSGEKYPKYYKYVTGNNGEKNIGFCGSTAKDYNIALNGTSGDKHCIIPIKEADLEAMSVLFTELRSGLFAALTQRVLEGVSKSEQYHKEKGPREVPTEQPKSENIGKDLVYSLQSMTALESFTLPGKDNEPCFKMKARTVEGKIYEVVFLSGLIKQSLAVFNQFSEYVAKKPAGTPLSIKARMMSEDQLRFIAFAKGA